MFFNEEEIILASASPRRRDYLTELGLDFTVQAPDIDETRIPGETPQEYVVRLAEMKGRSISASAPGAWVVSGDTVVCLGSEILGKPEDEGDAIRLLMKLSGKCHTVISSYSLQHFTKKVCETSWEATQVTFARFSENLARAYAATGEPLDKAGAYGIQGRGAVLVESITGSYSNVVGVPLRELFATLQKYGIVFPSK